MATAGTVGSSGYGGGSGRHGGGSGDGGGGGHSGGTGSCNDCDCGAAAAVSESNLRGDGSGVEDVCEFVRDCVVTVWCREARGWANLRAHAHGWCRFKSAQLTCGPPAQRCATLLKLYRTMPRLNFKYDERSTSWEKDESGTIG